MKEVKGIFKIVQSFNITNRGIVVIGHFLEGYPLIGYFLVVDIDGQPATVKIKGIERGKVDAEGKMPWGLTLHFDDVSLEKIAETNGIKEQVVEIFAVS